jgi:hypothetical protein
MTGSYDPDKFAAYAPNFRVVGKPFTAPEIIAAIKQSLDKG